MYLHLGQDIVVRDGDVIGIFDLEKTSVAKRTREFLSSATRKSQVITVSYEMPKSFVVASHEKQAKVYISQISTATLKKRASGSAKI